MGPLQAFERSCPGLSERYRITSGFETSRTGILVERGSGLGVRRTGLSTPFRLVHVSQEHPVPTPFFTLVTTLSDLRSTMAEDPRSLAMHTRRPKFLSTIELCTVKAIHQARLVDDLIGLLGVVHVAVDDLRIVRHDRRRQRHTRGGHLFTLCGRC